MEILSITQGDIVQHFKRELCDEETLKREPDMYRYKIIGIAEDTTTSTYSGDAYVVYEALYGGHELYVRKVADFIKPIHESGVRQAHRFVLYMKRKDSTI